MITADMAMSLDGFIAGTSLDMTTEAGQAAARLHEWYAGLASWRERQGLEGGAHNRDSEIVGDWFDATGAVIMGRTMYDGGIAFWGDNPPFRAPVFVLTHRLEPFAEFDGGTSFTFVADGVHSALEQARAVAGGKNVDISGGADTVRQFLDAGLIDELQVHVVPLLLGAGVRLFDGIGRIPLVQDRVLEGDGVTHLRYRVTTGPSSAR